MLTDERAGADLAISGALRGCPQDHGIGPLLRNGESQLAMAHGGLQHHERLAPGILVTLESDADGGVIDNRLVGADRLIAHAFERSNSAVADNLVPLLIEARTLPAENQYAERGGSSCLSGILHFSLSSNESVGE